MITPQGRLLVFGGHGFVGAHLVRAAQIRGCEAWVADSCPRPDIAQSIPVDISQPAQVEAAILDARPDAVINVAAIADIDSAQRDNQAAWRVNVDGACNIATACARGGIRHVFISTDAVFDGQRPPYRETDPVSPVNYYGKTKVEAESRVREVCPGAAITRLSLVLGLALSGGNSFFSGLRKKLSAGETIAQPVEEIRTPIDVYTLCGCLLELSAADFAGILHLGSTGSIDRLSLSRRCAQALEFDPERITCAVAQTETKRAPRHTAGVLDTSKARAYLSTKLLSLEETIARAVIDPAFLSKNSDTRMEEQWKSPR